MEEKKEEVNQKVEKEQPKDVSKEQNKESIEPLQKEEGQKKETKEPSPLFVGDGDVFDISIKYYKDGKKLKVEDEEDFNASEDGVQELVCTLKYPSQGDSSLIASQSAQVRRTAGVTEELSLRDFIQLEFIRFAVLVRKWNLDETLDNNTIMKLHPKVVKSALGKVREEIEMDGIF